MTCACIFGSLISEEDKKHGMEVSGGHLPALLVKSHIIWNKTKIEYICRSFQFRSLKFGIDMSGCLRRIAGYDSIIISCGVEKYRLSKAANYIP
jgi:hypothetical protein